MADYTSLRTGIKSNTTLGTEMQILLDSLTGDEIVSTEITGSLQMTGSQINSGSFSVVGRAAFTGANAVSTLRTANVSIVGPASASVSGAANKWVGTGSVAALIFSGSHVQPGIASGGQVGEWRFVAPYLYVCTGSVTGNFLVFTGSQV